VKRDRETPGTGPQAKTLRLVSPESNAMQEAPLEDGPDSPTVQNLQEQLSAEQQMNSPSFLLGQLLDASEAICALDALYRSRLQEISATIADIVAEGCDKSELLAYADILEQDADEGFAEGCVQKLAFSIEDRCIENCEQGAPDVLSRLLLSDVFEVLWNDCHMHAAPPQQKHTRAEGGGPSLLAPAPAVLIERSQKRRWRREVLRQG